MHNGATVEARGAAGVGEAVEWESREGWEGVRGGRLLERAMGRREQRTHRGAKEARRTEERRSCGCDRVAPGEGRSR